MHCLNIAAYKFVPLDDLPRLRRTLWDVMQRLNLRGTILISLEGINMFIAGEPNHCEELLTVLANDPRLIDIDVKRSWTDYQPFNRALVKIKKEIIAFGIDSIKPSERTSPKLDPKELKQWLDEGRPVTLLDTRNIYEVELGTFKDAIDLRIDHFREFPDVIDRIPESEREKPIVMFCTGGIRCEKAGPMMEQAGFKNVFQLDGGILNYFEQCGSDHYDGDCFVFDQRVAVQPNLKPSGAKYCFTCQHTLTTEDLQSDHYRIAEYCPHCYESPETIRQSNLEHRQRLFDQIALSPPGSVPYENRRPMFVARQFAGYRLIDWLCQLNPNLSLSYWQNEIDSNRILFGPIVEKATDIARAEQIVREGERFIQIEPDCVEPTVDARVRILYEDEAIVIVNKPASLPSHPSGRSCRNTLEYIVSLAYKKERLRLAHRLDSETSGILLLTRKQRYSSIVQRQFQDGTIRKIYLAKVIGHPVADEFQSTARISSSPSRSGSRVIDEENGQEATTNFRVLHRNENGTAILEVKPITGRTHQIRLHLSHLGFPIVNDPLYGGYGVEGTECSSALMCLHAWRLSLIHPMDRKPLDKNYFSMSTELPEWLTKESSLVTLLSETPQLEYSITK